MWGSGGQHGGRRPTSWQSPQRHRRGTPSPSCPWARRAWFAGPSRGGRWAWDGLPGRPSASLPACPLSPVESGSRVPRPDFTRVAVIPAPDFKQKQVILDYIVRTAKAVGVEKPKVAVIAATEQVLPSQPATIEAAMLAKMADRGQIKGCIVDGPLALDVAIDQESVEIKGLVSPVAGDADCLLFPNIESGNVFYKSNSKLVPGVRQAGILVGAKVPCVLSSRADSIDTKLNSIAIAAMSAR